MKLQSALIINSLASLLMIIVWVPLSNVARENFNVALANQADSKEILQNFVELNEATRTLTLSIDSRTLGEWEKKYEVASIRLLPQYFTGSTGNLILNTIQVRFRDLKETFTRYTDVLESAGLQSTNSIIGRESLSELSQLSHEILEEVLLFTDLRQGQLTDSSQLIDVYRTSTIIGAFIAITLINYLIYQSISLPVRKLALVSEEISKGNFQVKLDPNDLPKFGEFGQLSAAFITMTSELESLYASLEDKVTSKTEALSHSLEEIEEEKEKFEEQVLETEKFKQAVDSATDGILIVRMDGEIAYANKSWGTITGYTPDDLLGQNIRTLQQKKSDEPIYSKIWQGMINIEDITLDELVNKRKNGDYYQAQIAIYPIKEDGEAKYYVSMQQDITKRKEVDKAKTEFVSLASHQLRTPLSTIGWYTEMLMSGDAGEVNDEQTKLLSEIADGNKRMVSLVNALLNVSRIELGTFSIETKWTNIIEISESVINELQHQVEEKKHKLNTYYDTTLPDIKTDPNLMRIVFQNLLSNSIKYTPEGGEIMVSIKMDPKNTAAGEGIIITISDNGVGIPGRQQDQLFTKLFRADNVKETDTEGTGLGLYLVKSIVDYAGGSIAFNSKENEGTTFNISLPIKGMEDKEGEKDLIPDKPKIHSIDIEPT